MVLKVSPGIEKLAYEKFTTGFYIANAIRDSREYALEKAFPSAAHYSREAANLLIAAINGKEINSDQTLTSEEEKMFLNEAKYQYNLAAIFYTKEAESTKVSDFGSANYHILAAEAYRKVAKYSMDDSPVVYLKLAQTEYLRGIKYVMSSGEVVDETRVDNAFRMSIWLIESGICTPMADGTTVPAIKKDYATWLIRVRDSHIENMNDALRDAQKQFRSGEAAASLARKLLRS